MRSIGHIQKRILEVLNELTRIDRQHRDWWSLLLVTVFLYHREQADPNYGSNPSRLGKFVVNWSHTKNEKRRVWESSKMLEKRGLIETRVIRINRWGGETKYMQLRLKR